MLPPFVAETMDQSDGTTAPAQSTPSAKSLKAFSCALCHRRKVKCDKKDPCTYCVIHRVPCIPAAPVAPRPRKKRFPEAELLARLKRYETALKSYGADLEAINSGDVSVNNNPSPPVSNKDATPGPDISFTPITPTKDEPTDDDESAAWPSAQDEVCIVYVRKCLLYRESSNRGST